MKRRHFLKSGLASSTAFALSGITALTPRHAQAATVNITLRAEGAYKTLIDGSSIFVWQFRDMNGISGPGALTSALLVKEGDTVNVTIENRIDRPVKFDINGVTLSTTLSVNSGSNRIYSFTAPAAGSYMYTDSHNGELGRAMGLAGPMVVMPSSSNNRLYNNGPTFNRQYTLFMSELDDRLNTAIESGSTYNMDDYEPNYYFANGLSYPETTSRSDTLISMNLGENVAIRFINGGAITYPMHFHGYHVNVATRNRKIETRIIEKDTVQVNRNECVDVILPVVQRGAYPLHTHYVPGVTANGSYANGGLIIMSAS